MFFHDSYAWTLQVLITDLDPDQRVKAAMNEINASKRLKYAVAERAEGDKILQVKAAEAEAEAKYLSGVGVAKQRKAIVDVRCRSSVYVSSSLLLFIYFCDPISLTHQKFALSSLAGSAHQHCKFPRQCRRFQHQGSYGSAVVDSVL